MWRMKSSPAARKAKQRSRVRREASYPGYSGTSAQARKGEAATGQKGKHELGTQCPAALLDCPQKLDTQLSL